MDRSKLLDIGTECPIVMVIDIESMEKYKPVTVKVKVRHGLQHQDVMKKETLADCSIKQDLLIGYSSWVLQ